MSRIKNKLNDLKLPLFLGLLAMGVWCLFSPNPKANPATIWTWIWRLISK